MDSLVSQLRAHSPKADEPGEILDADEAAVSKVLQPEESSPLLEAGRAPILENPISEGVPSQKSSEAVQHTYFSPVKQGAQSSREHSSFEVEKAFVPISSRADHPTHPANDEKTANTEPNDVNGSTKPSGADMIMIPDLFVSFVAQRPKLNPYYEEVKGASEAWMKR